MKVLIDSIARNVLKHSGMVAGIVFVLLITEGRATAQLTVQYQTEILDPFGTYISPPAGIAFNNTIVGSYNTINTQFGTTNLPSYGYVRVPGTGGGGGTFQILSYPNSNYNTYFTDVNHSGVVTGYYLPLNNSGPAVSFILSNGSYVPFQVNNLGTIVTSIAADGTSVGYTGGGYGFVRDAQGTILSTFYGPNGEIVYPYGINDAGWVVGAYYGATTIPGDNGVAKSALHAFALYSGIFYNIDPAPNGSLRGTSTDGSFLATSINNNLLVTVRNGPPVTAGVNNGPYAISSYIINLNILFQNNGVYIPNYFQKILLPGDGVIPANIQEIVTGINDSGYIIGTFTNNSNQTHSFIGYQNGQAFPNSVRINGGASQSGANTKGIEPSLDHPRALGRIKLLNSAKVNPSRQGRPSGYPLQFKTQDR